MAEPITGNHAEAEGRMEFDRKKKKKKLTPEKAEAKGRARLPRENPGGARGEHIPHDVDGAENIGKRDFSRDERRRLASLGHALPSGAYPIENEEDLHNAAVLARTGHGDVEAARRLIARRARELGAHNPLDEDNVSKRDSTNAGGQKYNGKKHPGQFLANRNEEAHNGDAEANAVPNKSIGNPYFSPFFDTLRSRGLAVGHPDLNQSSTDLGPTVQAGSGKPTFIGGAGFHSAFSGTDRPQGADEGRPRVQLWDAAAQAGGHLDGVRHDVGDEHASGEYRSAPMGQHNGTHGYGSQYGACTTPRPAMKNMDRMELIKQAMRDQGII